MEQTITTKRAELWQGWWVVAGLLGVLSLFTMGLWNLAGPALWWDEGWTLSVARTWVERGHYGRLLNGQLATGGLQAALPVTGSVALSFKLFGVGVWQGRLPGVLAMLVALALIYTLAARLYDRRVGLATLFVLLFMSIHPQQHPLIMGRQVIGELYMFCFLLAGYLGLLLALRRSAWWLVLAMVGWALALNTKAQVLPFWLVALVMPLVLALVRRRRREAGLLGLGGLGTFVVLQSVLPMVSSWIVSRQPGVESISLGAVQGLYDVTALVPNAFNRWFAVQIALITGLPTLCGLCYGLWLALNEFRRGELADADAAVGTLRLSLLALAGSWFGWFVLLSVGVPRYLFPATFIGSMFVAAWLSELTSGFDLAATLKRALGMFRNGGLNRQSGAALLVILLLAATIPITLQTLARDYFDANDRSAQQTADFLHTQTLPDARIETYESELHFLLDRPYHFPTDQVHVELNRRGLLHQETAIEYDPLANDPDYLVVGRFARGNDLYAPVIASGAFRLIHSFGSLDGYLIYERIR
jgi:hypothetical protein